MGRSSAVRPASRTRAGCIRRPCSKSSRYERVTSSANNCALLSPPLYECSPAPKEGIRVRTPFLYPDGGLIDVFVCRARGPHRGHRLRRSARLAPDAVPSEGSSRQGRSDSLRTYASRLASSASAASSFAGQKMAMSHLQCYRSQQAALRVADLWFTMRTRAVESVADEVADWLTEKEIPFERRVTHPGRSGRVWTVDFTRAFRSARRFVFLLATGSRRSAPGRRACFGGSL